MNEVSVIGLGKMGAALADTLVQKGFRVTVWNRSSAKADPLVARGAERAATVLDAVKASPLLLVCLTTYDAVRTVLETTGAALSRRALVNLTSGTPGQTRELAKWAAERGADYLCGGIMAIPPMIGKPGALVLYSGSQAAFEHNKAPLESLAAAQYLGPDPGRALLIDIALLTGMYGLFSGTVQALALARAEKVPAKELMPMLINWLNAMMRSLPMYADKVDDRNYSHTISSLAMQTEGFGNLIATNEALGVSTELVGPLYRLMQRGVAEGHGASDFASLVEMLHRL